MRARSSKCSTSSWPAVTGSRTNSLATLTHELRTPMNGVIGSLELMQTVPLDDDLANYQQTAAGSARDMMRMVNGILTLTELQAGRLSAQPRVFSLRGVLDTLRQQFSASAQSKGLAFSIDVADDLPDRLRGDADKLSQCLDCLLDNAFKFTHEGVVRLRVVGVPLSDGSVRLSFIVTDTGIGFAFLDEATLYQRFFQLDWLDDPRIRRPGDWSGDLPATDRITRRAPHPSFRTAQGQSFSAGTGGHPAAARATPGKPRARTHACAVCGAAGGRQQRRPVGGARHVAQARLSGENRRTAGRRRWRRCRGKPSTQYCWIYRKAVSRCAVRFARCPAAASYR